MANTGGGTAATNGAGVAVAGVTAAELFAGPGEVRALARTLDWGATPLGWPDTWSPALRIATHAMLDAPHPICLWSGPEYALVYNDAYRRILAAKHPAALGQPGPVVWAEIWSALEAQFAQVWQGGAPVYGEDARFVMARLEGGATEVAWFSYSLSALRDEDGCIVAVLNISPETTARVRAEQALAAERERLRNVVLRAPVPMALHEGPEHRYVLVNDAYKRVSGGRDVTGLTLREAFPEVAGQGLYEVFDRVYATGESWSGPETHLHYDRSGAGPEDAWFHLRYDPVRDPHGQISGILNFSVDVTDQVLARREVERLLAESEQARATAEAAAAALAESEARLRLALDVAELGTWTWDLVTGAGDLDARGAEIVGLPPGDLADVTSAQLAAIHPDDLAATHAALAAAVERGTPFALAYRVVGADGSVRHVASRARVLTDATGRPTRLVGTNRDVTAEREAAAERDRLLAAAEEERERATVARLGAEAANQAKSQFLATMSHELRTPLNAIGGYAELIELGIHGPVTDAQRTALARIQASQRHLLGLIAGVLDYSRVEAGAVTYRLADVPVAEAVAEAEALVAPQLRAKGLGYGWSGAAPGLVVRADREKLQQILLNLLGNAIKFTDAREGVPGRVEIACSVERVGTATGDLVRIHVLDTGEGIAAAELERVFAPFVQADQRLTRPHAGVGLGLAISRDLARGMGGDLAAESTPGVGSIFTLILPRGTTPGTHRG